MSKYKAGLHKDVSSIFNGVSIPKNDASQKSSADPALGHNTPKPSVPEPPAKQLPVSQPPVQKSSASGSLTQKLPVLQPPVHKPSVSQSPAHKPPVSQEPTQKPSTPESPTQKLSASQPPERKPSVPQPPAAQPSTQKPLASGISDPKSPVSESPALKPPASSNAAPIKSTTQPPPSQSQPKETPAKQSKAGAAAKNARQPQWQRKLGEIKAKLFAPKPGTSTAKQKVMVVALPVLFIVLIFVFIRVFSAPARNIKGAKKTDASAKAVSDRKVDWKIPEPYPTTLRDPMQFGPAGEGKIGTGELTVKGIVYSIDNPTAIIGSQVVHQGDRIGDVIITKINENNVEFEANGKKWMQNVQR